MKDATTVPVSVNTKVVSRRGKGVDHSVLRDISVIKASAQAEHRLPELLTTLHDVVLELSNTGTFDDLCRRAIELGRNRLGFDRLGLWFALPRAEIQGSFGTDERGRLRDERRIRIRVKPTAEVARLLASKTRMAVHEAEFLVNHRARPVGRGTHLVAALWDGGRVIGFLGADNLIRRRPIDMAQRQVLALYATALGHLCSRTRAVAELRASEEKYRTLVESAGEAISTVNRKGVFLFMNNTAASRLGGKPADLVGKTVWDLFPKAIANRHAASIRRVIRTQQGSDVDSLTELRGHRRWYRTTVAPVLDTKGKVHAALVIARDQTEHKKAEDSLRQSEEKYRQLAQALGETLKVNHVLLNATDSRIFLCDKKGQILAANQEMATSFGTTCEQLVGMNAFESLPPELAASRKAIFKKVLDTGAPIVHQDVRNGRRLKHRFSPIVNEAGKVVQVAIASHDITDITAFQDALERKTLAMEEVLAHVQENDNAIRRSFAENVRNVVPPSVDALGEGLTGVALAKLKALQGALNCAMSPSFEQLTDKLRALTRAEIRVCWSIRNGLSTREVARIEHISPMTVNKHRENIRRKLGLTNRRVNLVTHLETLMMPQRK